MVGLGCDDGLGQDRARAVEGQFEALDQAGEDQDRFRHGELGSDADAGAGAEGHEGEARRARGVWQEAGGDEGFGVGPEGVVAVQDPGGDHDDGAAWKSPGADLVGEDGFAHQGECGGKQAHCFVDDGADADEFGLDPVLVQVQARDFPGQPVLDVRRVDSRTQAQNRVTAVVS